MSEVTDVDCPFCGAVVDEPCDAPQPHPARVELADGHPAVPMADWDGDGVDAWRDPDDPAGWF